MPTCQATRSPRRRRTSRTRRVLTLLLFVIALPDEIARAQDFPSPTGGGPTPLLFLHPLVNYREDPSWTRTWERGLQSGNSLRVNVGSVSTDDLLSAIEFHLTEAVGARFRALYDLEWFEAMHVESTGQEHFLGMEYALAAPIGVQLQVHPTSRKEDLDLRAGFLLHDVTREHYLRLLLRWDNPLYEEKNDLEAVSDRSAKGLEWTARASVSSFELFSRGRYGSGWERRYPNELLEAQLAAETLRRGGSSTRVRALAAAERFLEVEVLHHEYEASATPRATGRQERYRNRIWDLVLRSVWSLDTRWRLRAELHHLRQDADLSGEGSYDYERRDWMPAVYVLWRAHPVHRFELGYLAAAYSWRGSPDPGVVPEDEGYAQKLKLGWWIEFSPRARMQISLSHEPDPQRFGGGNVQLLMAF